MAEETKGLVLLDNWLSPFGQRCRIALAEKGVAYERREEDLLNNNKSKLLLQSNPVYKKVPVLLHGGKVICESSIIVNYIDEVWPAGDKASLLPKDPYARANAFFWAYFGEQKIHDFAKQIWKVNGEVEEAIKKEFIENLKYLELELGDKKYFGGDIFGFLDVALAPLTAWFYTYETYANFSMEKEVPKMVAWGKRCMERESVAKNLPDPVKVFQLTPMIAKAMSKRSRQN